MPAFVLFAAKTCIGLGKEVLRGKWLWLLFILVGFGKLSFNWTTADFTWQSMALSLLGGSVYKPGPYVEWMFSISLPIGALTFMEKLRRIKSGNSSV